MTISSLGRAMVAAFIACTCPLLAQVNDQPGFGQPLDGAPIADFLNARTTFSEIETVAKNGLGPTFNGNSCAQCHAVPAVGGGSALLETRAQLYNPVTKTSIDLPGGSLFDHFAIDLRVQELVPPQANVVSSRASLPLFGDGLIEAVPDEDLQDIASSQAYGDDGIHGRVNMVSDLVTHQLRAGRFGWKAQHATLLDFSADAYMNEMGITNLLFPVGRYPNGDERKYDLGQSLEPISDPKDKSGDIFAFETFVRFLAPPPRGPITEVVRRGEHAFERVGCAQCHCSTLMTGESPYEVLAHTVLHPYSDLLLHDIETGNSVAQSGAGPFEVKTPPLWGIRVRTGMLHDRSAASIPEAIHRHRGEARKVRERFDDLPDRTRDDIIAFLKSL